MLAGGPEAGSETTAAGEACACCSAPLPPALALAGRDLCTAYEGALRSMSAAAAGLGRRCRGRGPR